jgi:dienelactone hydrolase
VPFAAPELAATTTRPAKIASNEHFDVFAVRWPAFGGVHGEGLLLVPSQRAPIADVVALPDCDTTPEQLIGLEPKSADAPPVSNFPCRMAASGCRVLVPFLVDRKPRLEGLTTREWLYRSAFELGRGLLGYEVQKVLAAVDWFAAEGGESARIGVFGYGAGGAIALYSGALDPRIDAVGVSGYFDSRADIWLEPIDRNVFGLLDQFGDAELASLIAPSALIVEAARGPEVTIPGGRGAPARIVTPELNRVRAELDRARSLTASLQPRPFTLLEVSGNVGRGSAGAEGALTGFLAALAPDVKLSAAGRSETLEPLVPLDDPIVRDQRRERQVHEIDRHTQVLLRDSARVRKQWFWDRLDYSSLAAYTASIEPFRAHFRDEVIGRFDLPLAPPDVRSRRVDENERWTRYEIVMDVFPDVIAYGLLTLPKGIAQGERRPAVVCQHGLEGRPQDTIGEPGYHYYKAFNTALADRGFITFSPQNLYIFRDGFRTLQRKANPLGKTLFSIMVPQHQQIVDWLTTLPQVDPARIAFYGLSYGGKTAMRVPPLVSGYCLSICSADFNEWVDKNASTSNPYSYVNSSEYEIFEFDLGSTFNYAEMAALVAPRPFMVERGHFDGVAADETVAFEYAKVRFLYAARLKIPERTAIEWFDGPHTINSKGTYEFLHRHLNWPEPR